MVVVSADTCATAVAGTAETKPTRAPMASPLQVSTKAATMTATKKPQPRPRAYRRLHRLPRAGRDRLILAHTLSAASPILLLLGAPSQPGGPHRRVLRGQSLQLRATAP